MRARRLAWLLWLGLTSSFACSSEEQGNGDPGPAALPSCEPGSTRECQGAPACEEQAVQTCFPTGKGWSACSCPRPGDTTSGSGGGAGEESTGSGGTSGASGSGAGGGGNSGGTDSTGGVGGSTSGSNTSTSDSGGNGGTAAGGSSNVAGQAGDTGQAGQAGQGPL